MSEVLLTSLDVVSRTRCRSILTEGEDTASLMIRAVNTTTHMPLLRHRIALLFEAGPHSNKDGKLLYVRHTFVFKQCVI